MSVEVEDKVIAVFNLDGEFFGVDDACGHAGGSLGNSELNGECIECLWHGARFNVRTGEFIEGPYSDDLATYPIRLEGDHIMVELA